MIFSSRVNEIDEERIPEIMLQVLELKLEGKDDEVLSYCNDVLAKNPNEAIAHQFKAMYFNDLGKHEEALECCDDAIQCSRYITRPIHFGMKAIMLYDAGKCEESLQFANKALRNGSDNQSLFGLIGLALHRRYNKNPDTDLAEKILHYYDKSLKDYPIHDYDDDISDEPFNVLEEDYMLDVLHNKGLILFELKRYDAAIECFEEYLCGDPDDLEILVHKAATLYKIGRKEESIKCCRYMTELPIREPDILCSLCARFYDLDLFTEALYAINKATKLDPFNARAKKYKRVIELKLNSE